MAIAHRSTSAVTFGANGFNVSASSPSVGDMMILLVAGKPYNSAVSTVGSGSTGEWNFLGTFTDGTVAAGVDVGSMFVSAWWMVYDGTNATVSVVEGTPAWNVVGALVMTFSKGASENWDTPVIVGGGDNTAGTGFSVTTGSVSLAAGDHTVTIGAFRSDAATPTSSSTRPTLSGITFSHTVDPATDPETTTGGDMGMSITRSSVFSGSATGAATLAATLAASHTGSAAMIRLRATASGPTEHQGSVTMPLNLAIDTAVRRETTTGFAQSVSPSIAVGAVRETFTAVTTPLGLAIVVNAVREALIGVTMPLGLAVDTAVRKETFGSVTFPLDLTISVEATSSSDGTEHFASVTFPLDLQVSAAAIRETRTGFAVDSSPNFSVGAVRETFSGLTLNISADIGVQATRESFAAIATALELAIETAVRRTTFSGVTFPLDLQITTNAVIEGQQVIRNRSLLGVGR